ncbi:hypothetical protein TNCV_4917851 [Trichonephila clavipes]|nr:hypothetical protein TNCV_4917851 [Trichonephila clavipes]
MFVAYKQYGMKAKCLTLQAVSVFSGVQIEEKHLPPLTANAELKRLGSESNWTKMAEMGNVFHDASSLFHTSLTILT